MSFCADEAATTAADKVMKAMMGENDRREGGLGKQAVEAVGGRSGH